MTQCPHCHKQLLSHNSPTCNWCGQEIADPNYQKQAAVGRDAFYAEQAQHDAVSLLRTEAIDIGDQWMMGPGQFGMGGFPGIGRVPGFGAQPMRSPVGSTPNLPPLNSQPVYTPSGVAPAFGHTFQNTDAQEPLQDSAQAVPAEPNETPAVAKDEERFHHLEL